MSPSPQTNFQFLKKILRWGFTEFKRYYQPIKYSEDKGPRYYRPLGYDDRNFSRKLFDKYFWVRGADHIIRGLINYIFAVKLVYI